MQSAQPLALSSPGPQRSPPPVSNTASLGAASSAALRAKAEAREKERERERLERERELALDNAMIATAHQCDVLQQEVDRVKRQQELEVAEYRAKHQPKEERREGRPPW